MKGKKKVFRQPAMTDLVKEMLESVIPPKRGSNTKDDDPTIAIKKQGRIILNRPSANVFLQREVRHVLLMMNQKTGRLFIKSVTANHPRAHMISYGKGGIPAMITGKSSLQEMGIDLGKKLPELKVEAMTFQEEVEGGFISPGDVVLTAKIPREYFR